jgi:hypothetical protein
VLANASDPVNSAVYLGLYAFGSVSDINDRRGRRLLTLVLEAVQSRISGMLDAIGI